MDKLVSLCARRGFLFQSSEIYGGINGFWDYGPLGAELKQNLRARWWQFMVRERSDVEGIDSAIIAHPRTWEASGHVESFTDPMVDCRRVQEALPGRPARRRGQVQRGRRARLHRGPQLQPDAHDARSGRRRATGQTAYLRPETCQPIFNDFKRVREGARQKLPFGIAQVGKAFRNEITPRNFTFRSREFEQAEMEFFCHPSEREKWFDYWLDERLRFHNELGFTRGATCARARTAGDELAHYCARAMDVEFLFPFGWQEIEGIHDRGDWDLSRHTEYSGKDLSITDEETKEKFMPMCIETSVGIDRTALALLVDAYS